MDKLYYNFKDLPFQWIRPKLKIQDWGIDPNVGRITFRAHPLQFFTTASLRFLNSLDIHVDDFCILLLGIPAGMAVDIHTDYVSPSDFKGNLYKGYWSLNVPIGTENVYTTWFDGPIKENHVYREEEAGNILYEAVIEKPNIVRTDIPHRVDNRGKDTTWRVCLRCSSPIKSWNDAVNLLGPYLEL